MSDQQGDTSTQQDVVFEPVKIDKWCGSAAHYTIDDHVHGIFTNVLDFKPSHKLMNIRLLISSAAVLSAGVALVYDYLNPFPLSIAVLSTCVILYFILTLILTLYSSFIEKGTFLVGYKNKEKISLSSNLKRYDHIYNLTIDYEKDAKKKTATMSESIANWFDDEGNLIYSNLEKNVLSLYKKVTSNLKKKSN